MGTETKAGLTTLEDVCSAVKLNNPLMGTETFSISS